MQVRVADPGLLARGPRPGRRLAAAGLDAIVTDDQGYFRAEGRVDLRHRYLACAEAAGCEVGRTRVVAPQATPEAGLLRFPDLVVERHPESPVVVGRVVGRDGRPIGGAVVADLARHRATADAGGWFQLEKVGPGGVTCLFVRHPDFRAAGRVLNPRDGDADRPIILSLTRRDEPAADRAMAEYSRRSAGRDLVRGWLRSFVVDPFVGRVLALGDTVADAAILEHLARVEPARVGRWLGTGIVVDPRVADGLRRITARELAPIDFAQTESILAAIGDPATRSRATLEALDRAGQLTPDRRRALLEHVEREARAVAEPERRVDLLARLAESWIDIDDPGRARSLVADGSAIAANLPRATRGAEAWCSLIRPLALLDPGQARRRLERLLDPADLDRCRLTIALRSARSRPIEAVQSFRLVRDSRVRRRSTAHLAYLLGPVAPDLARGLADAIRTACPLESAHALGMLAAALGRGDRPAAVATLDEAFARLEASSRHEPTGGPETDHEPAAVAAALLPVAEAIDPALVPEYFWRAVALRPVRPQPNFRADAILALLLDRYEPAVARALFDPARTPPLAIAPDDLPPLLLAASQLAPLVALEWADHPARPADPRAPATSPNDRPHLALIAAWTETERGRWDRAVRCYLDLWTPDDLPGAL